MEITVSPDRLPPAGALTGTLHDAPPGGADLVVYTRTNTPFGRHVAELSTTRASSGPFELAGPRWPTSGSGPLLSTEWWVEARAPGGEVSPPVPFEVTVPATVVESVRNDDLDAPPRGNSSRFGIGAGVVVAACAVAVVLGSGVLRFFGIFVGAIAVVAFIGALMEARQDAVFGRIRCRVDPRHERLEFAVRIHPPDGRPPDDITITAELRVIEEARRKGGDGTGTTKSETAYSELIELQRDAHLTWTGSIDLTATRGAALSREGIDGAVHWKVAWVVRFAIGGSGTPDAVRVRPLIAYPEGQDRNIGVPDDYTLPVAAKTVDNGQ